MISNSFSVPPGSGWCQRWRHHRHSWRHRHEGGFDRDRYDVVALAKPPAREFVQTHHYLSGWPACRMQFGMLDMTAGTGELVGVVALAVPMQQKVLTGPFPQLVPYVESLDLARLVLLDQVPANAESWFCARAFRLAAQAGIRGLVAYSDPHPRLRRTPHGKVITTPGHHGGVYQALSARYLGRGTARTLTMLPDGTVLTARAESKIRRLEPGHRGVERRLVLLGAPPRGRGQDPKVWLPGALHAIGATKGRHPGNHRYAFTLGRTARERSRVTIALGPKAYPKRDALGR